MGGRRGVDTCGWCRCLRECVYIVLFVCVSWPLDAWLSAGACCHRCRCRRPSQARRRGHCVGPRHHGRLHRPSRHLTTTITTIGGGPPLRRASASTCTARGRCWARQVGNPRGDIPRAAVRRVPPAPILRQAARRGARRGPAAAPAASPAARAAAAQHGGPLRRRRHRPAGLRGPASERRERPYLDGAGLRNGWACGAGLNSGRRRPNMDDVPGRWGRGRRLSSRSRYVHCWRARCPDAACDVVCPGPRHDEHQPGAWCGAWDGAVARHAGVAGCPRCSSRGGVAATSRRRSQFRRHYLPLRLGSPAAEPAPHAY